MMSKFASLQKIELAEILRVLQSGPKTDLDAHEGEAVLVRPIA